MKPIAIISVDDNPDYLFLLPIICKSWENQGFKCHIVLNHVAKAKCLTLIQEMLHILKVENTIEYINKTSDSNNQALYTQCYRMYVPQQYSGDQYLIMTDVDMFIASSFLYRDFDKVNVFGHDLTGFGQIPMCYVGMTADKWKEVMLYHQEADWYLTRFYSVERDLSKYADKYSQEFEKWWGCDQDIITAKLKNYGFDKINFVNRAHDQTNSGLPMGRWDRYNWVMPTVEIHDVHLLRNPTGKENFEKIKDMCKHIYPDSSLHSVGWEWLDDYRTRFMTIFNLQA